MPRKRTRRLPLSLTSAHHEQTGLVLRIEVLHKDEGAIRPYEALGWTRCGELSPQTEGQTFLTDVMLPPCG